MFKTSKNLCIYPNKICAEAKSLLKLEQFGPYDINTIKYTSSAGLQLRSKSDRGRDDAGVLKLEFRASLYSKESEKYALLIPRLIPSLQGV